MTNQTWSTISQIAILVAAVVGALGVFGVAHFRHISEQEKERRAAMTGVVAPKIDRVLDLKAHVLPEIELGTNSGAIIIYGGPAGTPVFQFIEDDGVTIVRENGVVKLSTMIRDKTGTIIAELVKNEWKVNPSASWDRNYSVDAVEVLNGAGDVVLQVKALPGRVQLSAKLYGPKGEMFGVGAAQPGTGGGGGIMTFNHDFVIPRIFKYPSSTHLGELAP
jgi:hypothetical protein